MPYYSTFLTDDEKRQFAAWLKYAIETCGKSKRSISRRLGYLTTAQLNRYLNGSTFPSPKTLRTIALAADVSQHLALLRAGYLREILTLIAKLSHLGAIQCDDWGVRFDPERGVTRIADLVFGSDFVSVSFDRTQNTRPYVPLPTLVAFAIAITCFKLASEGYRQGWEDVALAVTSRTDDLAQNADGRIAERGERNTLPRLLGVARLVLENDALDRADRRSIAAVAVRLWAHKMCEPLASYLESAAYQSRIKLSYNIRPDHANAKELLLADLDRANIRRREIANSFARTKIGDKS